MGIVRMGIPEKIVEFLQKKYQIQYFVETGTFKGGTAKWAAKHFDKVDTIEFSEIIYKETKENLAEFKNINCIFGDSRAVLPTIMENASQQILFWLDAHWCSGDSYGEEDQCPLIEELKIINNSELEHVILIDDARLFTAPPPLPNLIKHYPNVNQIMEVLKNQYLIVFEDVLFILPLKMQDEFNEFMQQQTTQEWEKYGERMRLASLPPVQEPKLKQTKKLLGDILRTWNLR